MPTNGHKRTQQLERWKNARLAGGIFIVLLFLYVQFTFYNAKMGDVPAHAKQNWQHQNDEGNEQGSLRGEGVDHYAAEKMLADEGVADVEVTDKTITSVPWEQQEARRLAVRDAMKFAWGNYEKHAFGADEIGPKDGRNLSDIWGNIACTLVDSIDTLWIMDLKDEFQRARDYVANKLNFSHLGRNGAKVSVFETIIREQKAKELMDLLTPAYDENEGVFYTKFNPFTKEKTFAPWLDYRAFIADIGTLQLETRYLSDITGDPKYAEMGDAFYKIVQREGSYNKTGLFPVHFDATRGKFDTENSSITLGGFGDSFYEYLLKVYIYSGKREEDKYLRELYDDAVRGMEKYLLYFSVPDDLYFVQDMEVPSLSPILRMGHLACFVPGMLALGTLLEKQDHAKNAKHLELAEKLMETCYQFYHRQATGLSPEAVGFPTMHAIRYKYRLRPETVESLFYLYRTTKNPKYREYGWKIFEALKTHAKTTYGYATVLNVTELPAQTENIMESFFWLRRSSTITCCKHPRVSFLLTNTSSTPRRILSASA